MNIYEINELKNLLSTNTYPGRGIVIGKTEDGKNAAIAYFIMGRSENSRNRVFKDVDGDIFTEPFDFSKVEDPSLIIYAAIRSYENKLVVTNGDQTDTIYNFLRKASASRKRLRQESLSRTLQTSPLVSAVFWDLLTMISHTR